MYRGCREKVQGGNTDRNEGEDNEAEMEKMLILIFPPIPRTLGTLF